MKTKAKKSRGPYRCALCRKYGHRADKCPDPHMQLQAMDALPGSVALSSLVPEFVQVVAVLENSTGEAIINIIQANQALSERGITVSNSMLNAWSELAMRAAGIPGQTIAFAREARRALIDAEAKYNEAIAPIKAALGHKAPPKPFGKALEVSTTKKG